MDHQGLSKAGLSRATKIDDRTIQRWLDGQTIPQAQNARTVADALDCQSSDLWPDAYPLLSPPSSGTIAVSVYASRAHVPAAVWQNLFSAAVAHIDICVYGGTFLFDTVPGFNGLMRSAAERGVAVRFMAGDPGSAMVHQRGTEEKIGMSLAGRCALTLERLAPLSEIEGIDIRMHGTPLYVSLFRCDDMLIANHHIHGSPASDNPALVITRAADPELWDKYETSFNTIWSDARPVSYPGQKGS